MKPGQEQPPRILHLLYHELRSCRSNYAYALDAETFAGHADLALKMRNAGDSGLRAEITFDDGHISNYEHALAILHTRGLTARFFITAGWTGKKPFYMDWAQVRELHEAGHSIGAHGWSHTFLTHCSGGDLDRELGRARRVLEDKLGTAVTTMSLPGGRFDRRVLEACREAGYTKVFSSIPTAEPESSGFVIGRLNIRSEMTEEWLMKLFEPGSIVLSTMERRYRIKTAARTLLGDRLYERLWVVLNGKEPDVEEVEAAADEDSALDQ